MQCRLQTLETNRGGNTCQTPSSNFVTCMESIDNLFTIVLNTRTIPSWRSSKHDDNTQHFTFPIG